MPAENWGKTGSIYQISVVECCNDRLQVRVDNLKTDETIMIDENVNDVRQLYFVLKQYFDGCQYDLRNKK